MAAHLLGRVRAKKEQNKRFEGLSPESQGQNLALTALEVPHSLDSGPEMNAAVAIVDDAGAAIHKRDAIELMHPKTSKKEPVRLIKDKKTPKLPKEDGVRMMGD